MSTATAEIHRLVLEPFGAVIVESEDRGLAEDVAAVIAEDLPRFLERPEPLAPPGETIELESNFPGEARVMIFVREWPTDEQIEAMSLEDLRRHAERAIVVSGTEDAENLRAAIRAARDMRSENRDRGDDDLEFGDDNQIDDDLDFEE